MNQWATATANASWVTVAGPGRNEKADSFCQRHTVKPNTLHGELQIISNLIHLRLGTLQTHRPPLTSPGPRSVSCLTCCSVCSVAAVSTSASKQRPARRRSSGLKLRSPAQEMRRKAIHTFYGSGEHTHVIKTYSGNVIRLKRNI